MKNKIIKLFSIIFTLFTLIAVFIMQDDGRIKAAGVNQSFEVDITSNEEESTDDILVLDVTFSELSFCTLSLTVNYDSSIVDESRSDEYDVIIHQDAYTTSDSSVVTPTDPKLLDGYFYFGLDTLPTESINTISNKAIASVYLPIKQNSSGKTLSLSLDVDNTLCGYLDGQLKNLFPDETDYQIEIESSSSNEEQFVFDIVDVTDSNASENQYILDFYLNICDDVLFSKAELILSFNGICGMDYSDDLYPIMNSEFIPVDTAKYYTYYDYGCDLIDFIVYGAVNTNASSLGTNRIYLGKLILKIYDSITVSGYLSDDELNTSFVESQGALDRYQIGFNGNPYLEYFEPSNPDDFYYFISFVDQDVLLSTNEYLEGEIVNAISSPTKEGYVFEGWYYEIELQNKATFPVTVDNNYTFYSKWTLSDNVETIDIIFESNGGTTINSMTIEKDTIPTKPTDPIKANCTFAGWYFDSSFSNKYEFTTTLSTNTTLYAKWEENEEEPEMITLTFESNGGSSVQSVEFEKGSIPEKPTNPTKENSTFLGWYLEESFINIYNFDIELNEDKTLYAKWEENEDDSQVFEFEIISSSNSSTGENEYILEFYMNIPNDTLFNKAELILTFNGLAGLDYDDSLYPILNSEFIPYDNGLYFTTYDYSCDLIDFMVYGGVNSSSSDLGNRVYLGKLILIILEDISIGGKISDDLYNTSFVENQGATSRYPVSIVGNPLLQYEEPSNPDDYHYIVTFVDEMTILATHQYLENETVSFISNPTKEGYTFDGWYENVELTIKAQNSYIVNSNLTFYAKFITGDEPQKVTINFDSNGGTNVDSITVDVNTTIEDEPSTIKSNYVFLGWFDENDKLIVFPFKVTKDLDLKAKWIQIDEELTNNGDVILEINPNLDNTFTVYVNNPDKLIRNGQINLDFNNNGVILSVSTNDSIIVDVDSATNQITFGASNGISNSFIYLCDITLSPLNGAPSAVIDTLIPDENNDISNYTSNSLILPFVYDSNMPYYELRISDSNVTTKVFTVDLYFNNPLAFGVIGGEFTLILPEGLSVLYCNCNSDKFESFYVDNGNIFTIFNQLSNQVNDTNLYVGSITFKNDLETGNYTIGGVDSTILHITNQAIQTDVTFKGLNLNVTKASDDDSNNTDILSILIDGNTPSSIENNQFIFNDISFDKSKVSYNVTVNPTSSVSVGNSNNVLGSITGEVLLDSLKTTINVLVTDINGNQKEYVLIINKNEEEEEVATVRLELLLDDLIYDVNNNGLIGFNVYITDASYNISGATLIFSFNDEIFNFVGSESIGSNGFKTTTYDTSSVGFTHDTYFNNADFLIGIVYFKLKNNPSVKGDYSFGVDVLETELLDSSLNRKEVLSSNATLKLEENSFIPTLLSVKATLPGNVNSVLFNVTEFETNTEGKIVLPEISYSNQEVDLYFTYNSGTILTVNSTLYNQVFDVSFNDSFSINILVVASSNETYTTREYDFILKRSQGNSDATLSSIYVSFNDEVLEASLEKQNESLYYASVDRTIPYIFRNDVLVSFNPSSDLSDLLFEYDSITSNEKEVMIDLKTIGDNLIKITVTSENETVIVYELTLTLSNKEKAIISDDNISSLSKVFDNVEITLDDIQFKVYVSSNEITDYTSNISIKCNDVLVSKALDASTYVASIQILESDSYLASDVLTKSFEITKKELTDEEIDELIDITLSLEEYGYPYTGDVIKPEVLSVKINNIILKTNEYSVSYGDETTNINVSKDTAYVIITGELNYEFTKKVYFEITPKSLLDSDVLFQIDEFEYSGKEIFLSHESIDGVFSTNKPLVLDDDYIILEDTYENNIEASVASVYLKGINNFKDQIKVNFTINPLDISNPDAAGENNDKVVSVLIEGEVEGVYSCDYNGLPQTPNILVYINDALIDKSNYQVQYFDNINAGTATVKITVNENGSLIGNPNLYKQFTINKISINSIGDDGYIKYNPVSDVQYTGLPHEPKPEIYFNENKLSLNIDYELSYEDNTLSGIAKVIVTGIGNFYDSFEIEFNICQALVDNTTLLFDIANDVYTFTSLQIKPQVFNVTHNGVSLNSDEYIVSYENNINVGIATVSVSLVDESYSGCATKTFVINPLDITENENVKIVFGVNVPTDLNYTYCGSFILPDYTLKLFDGDILLDSIEITSNLSLITSFVDVGSKQVIITPNQTETNYIGSKAFTYYINQADINGVTLPQIEDQSFTGSEITPNVMLKFGDINLTEHDYNLQYLNDSNINIGTAVAKIDGIGNFTGTMEVSLFEIVLNSQSTDFEVRIDSDTYQFEYNRMSQKPDFSLYLNDVKISEELYEIIYPLDTTNVGVKDITIKGIGTLDGILISTSYEITKKSLTSQDLLVLEISSQVYLGIGLTPTIEIKHNGESLIVDTDFNSLYENNIEVSSNVAYALVEGINNYKDSIKLYFDILPLSDETMGTPEEDDDITILVEFDDDEFVYNRNAHTPTINLYANGNLIDEANYTLSYENNINAGEANIIITGVNNLLGFEKEVKFTIKSLTIASNNILNEGFSLDEIPYQIYTGSEILPNVTLKYDSINMIDNLEYQLSALNNIDVTDNALLTITGIGNYTGSITVSFEIKTRSSIKVELSVSEYVYTGSSIVIPHSNFIFKDENDLVLSISSNDYVVTYTNNVNVSYDSNLNVIAGANASIEFTGSYSGTVNVEFMITPKSILDFVISDLNETYEYTGAAICPQIGIYTDESLMFKVNSQTFDFEYENNVNVSIVNKAVIYITGKGNYKDTLEATFLIVSRVAASNALTIEFVGNYVYTGSEITPDYNLYLDGNLLDDKGSIKFYKDQANTVETQVIDASLYYAVVTVDNQSLQGQATAQFTVDKAQILRSFIQNDNLGFTYNNEEIVVEQSLVLKYLENTLVLNDDFTVSYDKQVNVGQYSISIEGKGNYKDEVSVEYVINQALITIKADDKTSTYLDAINELSFSVTDGVLYGNDDLNVSLQTTATEISEVGAYPITINANNSNYLITLVDGIYLITVATFTPTINDQVKNYTGQLIYPTFDFTLPDEITMTIYDSNGDLFQGAINLGDYNLEAVFTTSNNYVPILPKSFVLSIETAELIKIKEDSKLSFIFLNTVLDNRGREKVYLKTYLELGYEHGVDDVLNNPNGINSSRIILGQISPMTSIVEFISNLENSSSFIRITSSNGRVMYDCNPEQLSSLNRRYVGTGFIVEYIVDGIVRDTVYLSVLGDLSGDGNMNATDLNGLTEYVKEPYDLEDEYLLSILIRNNGTVSATDLNIITEAIIEDSDLDSYFYVKPTVDDETEGQLSRNNESRIIEESSYEIVTDEKETNNFEVINDSYILDDVTNDNESTSQIITPCKVEDNNEYYRLLCYYNLLINFKRFWKGE